MGLVCKRCHKAATCRCDAPTEENLAEARGVAREAVAAWRKLAASDCGCSLCLKIQRLRADNPWLGEESDVQ